MGAHIISRRIQTIIQFIYDLEYPSKNDILIYLNEKDFNLSARTLERDFDIIRADFGLDIVYSKKKGGYFINEEESIKVHSFFKFLEIVSVANIFNESLKDNKKILEYVSFDDSKYFKGIKNLNDVLVSLTGKRKLNFTYESFTYNTFKKYEITPFLLKEYENRWYVIGVPDGLNDIRTFGIDRISNLKVGKLSKINKEIFTNQLKSFDNIVGLNYSNNQPENIRLLVNKLHIKHMRSLPLHHSQVIHQKNENGQSFVDFFLVPNYEFISQVLKIGSDVEVIYPKAIRERVYNILRKTIGKYESKRKL